MAADDLDKYIKENIKPIQFMILDELPDKGEPYTVYITKEYIKDEDDIKIIYKEYYYIDHEFIYLGVVRPDDETVEYLERN